MKLYEMLKEAKYKFLKDMWSNVRPRLIKKHPDIPKDITKLYSKEQLKDLDKKIEESFKMFQQIME